MMDKQVPHNDDELGALGAAVEAIRAKTPDEAQWTAARHKLMATLELAAKQPATPSALAGESHYQAARGRMRWFAVAATLVAVLMILLFYNVRQRVGEESRPSAAVGQVEQTCAVFVRSAGAAEERPLRPEDILHAGDRVRIAPEGGLQVCLTDGSRLWLAGSTEAECVGPRSDKTPAWRLLHGEIQADIAPAGTHFRIAAPGTELRVLGTEFHVRVYPKQEPIKEAQSMKSAASILQQAIVVLTVLSGSVAVEADGQQQVVPEGTRVTVDTAQQKMTTAEASHIEYLRKWVSQRISQPGQKSSSEVFMFVKLHPGLLNRLMAVDVETGKVRLITDFIGGWPEVIQRVNPDLALLQVESVLYSKEPVSEYAGHPIIDNKFKVILVDLTQGEKAPIVSLEKWLPFYIQISPDRRKLAFLSLSEAGLLVMDLETFKPMTLLKGAMKTAPAWSPDSRLLAISKAEGYQTAGHEIVLIDALSGEVKSTGLKGAGAAFSPDGKRMVYSGGFRKEGFWYGGVPADGNLFIVTLPNGRPEQLTHLPEGGAIQPVFSPDGSYIAYWEMPCDWDMPSRGTVKNQLHIVDLAAKKDQVVLKIKENALPYEIRWTHDNVEFIVPYFDFEKDVQQVKCARREGDTWTVTEPKIELPKAGENEGVRKFAQRLTDVFTAHREGLQAQDLHRLEEARKKYALARDLAAGIVKDLQRHSGVGVRAVKLQPSDVLPYQEAMAKKAAVSPQELSVQVVRTNLEFYIGSLLEGYYREHDRFPPGENDKAAQAGGEANSALPSFEQWIRNLPTDWEIDYIRGTDRELVRRFFVIPGDDPEKKATSYEVVRSDKDALVLRTPVLANGKRLEATYRVEEDKTYENQGEKRRWVDVKATIDEVD